MKECFIRDIAKLERGAKLQLKGWVKSRRTVNSTIFIDIVDSTGTVQALIDKGMLHKKEDAYRLLKPESSVVIDGVKQPRRGGGFEILILDFHVVGEARINLQPRPRAWKNMFDCNHADHVLKNRHFYLRNEKQAAVLRFKSFFIFELHRYLNENGYVFIDAPVLTRLLLYGDSTAFRVDYHEHGNRKRDIFLSQCCMFQLEAAAHVFEKVYNITPSFRAEHSRSNRHLREYWHLKVEIAWADLEDLVKVAGKLLYTVVKRTVQKAQREMDILGWPIDPEEVAPPYPSIAYDEAVEIIHKAGKPFVWGKNLGTEDEEILTKEFGEKPLWVREIPCCAEAFPFARDASNPDVTRSCDLICPRGFGELLGVAEKITSKSELLERMAEKGREGEDNLERYGWYLDLRDYGVVPHGGIGMGIERVVRYLLKLPHIRYAVSFPRLFGRTPNP
jgi:asparaginyl-tRNA synthetase